MPVSHVKKNFEDIGVMGLRQETIKNGYSTLVGCVSQIEASQWFHALAAYPRDHEQSSSSVLTYSFSFSLCHRSQKAGFLES